MGQAEHRQSGRPSQGLHLRASAQGQRAESTLCFSTVCYADLTGTLANDSALGLFPSLITG